MAIAHIYRHRCLLGWYNSPGSFHIFKQLGSFVESTSPTGSPSESVWHTDPRKLLKLDAHKRPRFHATQSGTVIEETGYLATLFLQECTTWELEVRMVLGSVTIHPYSFLFGLIFSFSRDYSSTPRHRPADSLVFVIASFHLLPRTSLTHSCLLIRTSSQFHRIPPCSIALSFVPELSESLVYKPSTRYVLP